MKQFMLQWLKNLIFALGILGLIAVFFYRDLFYWGFGFCYGEYLFLQY